MFNPEGKEYGLNRDGQPEFGTITITIDDVSNNPALGDDVVQKVALSTQDLIAAVTAQAIYFGQPALFANPSHGRLLLEAGRQDHPVFVYVTPRENTTQIITSTPTWEMLVQHPSFGKGSLLLAVDQLQQVVAQSIAQAAQFLGGIPQLSLLDLSPAKFDPEVSGSSEGGRGYTAEEMLRSADITTEAPPAPKAKKHRRRAKASA